MPKITFRSADGAETVIDAIGGFTLMETAVNNGVEGIEGECGGGLSCGTCHVHIDSDFAALLEPALPGEIEMLELLPGRDDRSRLACQIKVTPTLEGMTLDIAAEQGL